MIINIHSEFYDTIFESNQTYFWVTDLDCINITLGIDVTISVNNPKGVK